MQSGVMEWDIFAIFVFIGILLLLNFALGFLAIRFLSYERDSEEDPDRKSKDDGETEEDED